MKLKLTHKRAWGNDRYYPACHLSKGLMKMFRQNCLSLEQALGLKELGFEIELLEEKPKI